MKNTIRVRARRAFILPSGRQVAAGTEFDITPAQAKYLLHNGKIERVNPAAHPAPEKTGDTKIEDTEGVKPPKGAKK